MDQISALVVFFVIVVVVVWAISRGPPRSNYIATTPHYPQTYYDQGGWNHHSPPRCGCTEGYSTDAPAPLHLADQSDLCQECIGHCQIKIWAGLVNVPEGMSDKKYCANDCTLECKLY